MYKYLLKHPELFQYAIGVKFDQFNELKPKFSRALRKAETLKAYSKTRLRDVGGGRKAALKGDFEKLFFILLYYKTYPTFRFASCIFEFDKRNVQLWKDFLAPVLFSALGYELKLKKRLHRINSFERWILEYPELKEFLVDATERAIQRPKGTPTKPNLQQEYYSGKKKYHTVKNQIIVSPLSRRILAVSDTTKGTIHDKKLFDQDPLFDYIPENSTAMADLGYQGTENRNLRLKIVLPQKKRPGEELTEEEKLNNKTISQIRVRVEHPISYLKHFNILSQKFRGRVTNQQNLDLPFKTISAIYNFTRPPD